MGEVFAGRYELVDPIGRGGVGAVWRAWDHRRRRYVAAKVLQQSDAHTLLRFVREQALRIEHPHVLAPASWAADDDKVLFTMDLVSGGSLAHVIGDYGPLPPRFVCTLLDQLLSGLSTVHAEGVVHRDIKPANILLEATGRGRPHLRLSDFGISMRKGEPRLTETNYVVGTLGYFAPEQMMGAEPDFPADLFAVGLVALYLLQGTKPDSQELIEHFAEHGTPSAPDGVPEPLWQVIAGLLQPDPQNRFRTATGARKALTAAVEMLPEPTGTEEPVEVFDQIGPLPEGFGPDGPVAPGSTAPAPAPTPAPDLPTPSSQTGSTAAMSETGSFHLPPPEPAVPAPHAPQTAAPAPPYGYPAPAPAAYTLPYTAPQQGAPFQGQAPGQTRSPGHVPEPAPHAGTRPGPSPKVAVPVLLVALVCFAVGIWALTRI
ncbi:MULTISPECIES: serine/threonine-protein kinase [unclassified Streptomyces]|uniref:serine/threonine-protein kinase n=1 Tax=unclassified Streptomyces TaxID=2593676 RepID=UPI000DAD42CC|nr:MULTISPECIES: serine/threonine-protein kinase [unclassified Streptomyces]PZT72851.1 serine/threonine protein kinase [Streptomyces sp. AC1-42T]PZT80830.1 serine/threonine protein kinase [Streptomyces sp. AC1-42W]